MRSDMQALSYFKWINFELSRAPAGRRPLIINMDETSLAYHIPGLKGTVVKGARGRDQASLSELRGHVSYLAAITDDAEIQPLLPQVLIWQCAQVHIANLACCRIKASAASAPVEGKDSLEHVCLHATLHSLTVKGIGFYP